MAFETPGRPSLLDRGQPARRPRSATRRRSIVVVRDITQRKQMEEALKEEKDFTDTAINAMTGIFFVQDRQWRFVRWNDAMEQLAARAGRTVEEIGGGVWFIPDDRDAGGAEDRGGLRPRLRADRGSARPRTMTSGTFSSTAGAWTSTARRSWSGPDSTSPNAAAPRPEQKRLQSAVERSAAEWKETFDTVTTPILIMERSGAVVRINRAALELSGLVGRRRSAGMRIDADRRWRAVADGVAARVVHRRRAAGDDGRNEGRRAAGRGTSSSRTFPLPDGDAERFILVLWEITGIVELQESLRRSETHVGHGRARGRRRARGAQSALRHLRHARRLSRRR